MRSESEIEEEIESQSEMLLTVFAISDEQKEEQVEKARLAWDTLRKANRPKMVSERKAGNSADHPPKRFTSSRRRAPVLAKDGFDVRRQFLLASSNHRAILARGQVHGHPASLRFIRLELVAN